MDSNNDARQKTDSTYSMSGKKPGGLFIDRMKKAIWFFALLHAVVIAKTIVDTYTAICDKVRALRTGW
jgi:hypothetical protein